MKRGVLLLSGLLVILSGAAFVHWAVGFPAVLPWPILLVVLAIGGGAFVIGLLRDQSEEAQDVTATQRTPRIYKKHRPRGRAKKRVVRNAIKRRRFRKMKPILLSRDTDVVNPGGDQVGFFG